MSCSKVDIKVAYLPYAKREIRRNMNTVTQKVIEMTCYWKKHLDQTSSWQNKDGSSKSDGKHLGRKNGTTCNIAVIAGLYNQMIASHTFSSQINKMGARWNINTSCSDYMCNNRSYFSSYKPVY